MKTFSHSEAKIKQWVAAKVQRKKTVNEICDEATISRSTLYNWLKRFPYSISPVPAKQLEGDHLVDSKYSDKEKYEMLFFSLTKVKNLKFKKAVVQAMVKRYRINHRDACEITGLNFSEYGYKPRNEPVDDSIVKQQLARMISKQKDLTLKDCFEIFRDEKSKWTQSQIRRVYNNEKASLTKFRKRKRNVYAKNASDEFDM